ncbi:MAG: DUF4091 domain-containing protein [Clostridia bacterium]|nr:DUF4091 domain-containing protein [Clostridia bacterium]
MKKHLTKMIPCLLIASTLLTACQQGDPINSGNPSTNGEIEVWSTYATEKVLQDYTDIYEDVRMPAEVGVEACKGEYESAQVIMTATKEVGTYTAEIVSDLVSRTTGAKFSKDNISLFHQKYIEVESVNSDYDALPAGWYPDALLPMEKAVEYDENKIEEGKNQGIYLIFNVPVEQAADTYTGSMKITYDGKEKIVPVTLTVYDLTVSQDTHSLSYFNLGFSQHLGELDGTQNGWRSYVETLIDYRLAPGSVLLKTDASEGSMDAFVEEVTDLVLNYGLSTISIPGPWKTGDSLSKIVFKLAQKSVDIDFNLLDRTIIKGTDEPKIYDMDKIKTETDNFDSGIAKAVGKMDALEGATAEWIEELKASAKAIPYIITMMYPRCDETNQAGVDTYCPKFQFWHSEEDRALYDDQWKGRWWYGCVDPRPPYPGYQMEHTLASVRAVGWMMSEYDIIGNLYWAATVYASWDWVKYSPIEDYYSTPARYPLGNGDGFLFYPGAPYGMDTPISSVRLEAIRDGNEEYEILYDLKKTYEEAGYEAADIQRYISDMIYSGTVMKIGNPSARFAVARKAIIQLALLAKEGVFITDVENDQRGNITFEILANDGYTLKQNGQTLSGTPSGEFTKYVVNVCLEQVENSLDLTVENAEKTYSFTLNLGGQVKHYEAGVLYAEGTFSDGNASVETKLESGKVQIDVSAVENKHQSIRYTSDLISGISANTQRLRLEIENPNDEAMAIRLLVRYKGASLNTELYSGSVFWIA